MRANQMNPAQVDPGQMRFDPLDFEDNMGITPQEARKEALAARAIIKRAIQVSRPDFEVRAWTLTGQLRKYKSFGVEDGRVRNVYYLTVSKK